jgi:hypothetical protein
MKATVTDEIELLLLWRDGGGEGTVRFMPASSSEFSIAVQVHMDRELNYQGDVNVSFQTMCYGCDLQEFAVELRRLAQGKVESARFFNTGGDFEIRIRQHEHEGKRILISELCYRHLRSIKDVPCENQIVLPVGAAEDVQQAATAVEELIRLLKVDCRNLTELPR